MAGKFSSATDLVYVVDIAARRMNTYWLNPNTKAIEPRDSLDLRKAFRK